MPAWEGRSRNRSAASTSARRRLPASARALPPRAPPRQPAVGRHRHPRRAQSARAQVPRQRLPRCPLSACVFGHRDRRSEPASASFGGPHCLLVARRPLHDPAQRTRTSRPPGHRRRQRAGMVSQRSDARGHTRRRYLAKGRGRISCETAHAASPARLRRTTRLVAGWQADCLRSWDSEERKRRPAAGALDSRGKRRAASTAAPFTRRSG